MLQANENTMNNITSIRRSIKGKVALYQGATQTDINYNDDLIDFKVDRVGEEGKFFGFGVSHKATVKIKDKERQKSILKDSFINIYLTATDDADFVCVTPNLYVNEVGRDENNNDITITVYDKLIEANTLTVEELELQDNYYIDKLINGIKTALGVSTIIGLDTAALLSQFSEIANLDGSESLRAVLDDIAEITQTIYFIDINNNLVFKQLDKDGAAVLEIAKSDYFTLTSKDNRTLATVAHITELGDNLTHSKSGVSGETQYLRENCFLNMNTNTANVISDIVNNIGGLSITEFSCSWRGNYLAEIGDKINIVTKNDSTITTYILNDSYTYSGGLKQETSWSYGAVEEESANPATIGEVINKTTAKVDKINKEITLVASEVKANNSAISALQINTKNITASVSSLATSTNEALDSVNDEITTISNRVDVAMTSSEVSLAIKEEMEKGVDKVTTSTGFTFNQDGLTISKSDSQMETNIDEDGMTVYRNDEAVLVANNTGVQAENLHATTYLIIGNYSRLEDYDNRTGCFWIGG